MTDSVARLLLGKGDWFVAIDTTRGGVTRVQVRRWAGYGLRLAATARKAADAFLADYRTSAFGIDPFYGQLELVKEGAEPERRLYHLKYTQRHHGFLVAYANIVVHVAALRGGFAVQSVSGFLFPDISVPSVPGLSFAQARVAAVTGMPGGELTTPGDSAPSIFPDADRYRLAYSVPVFRSEPRGTVIRLVDAMSGEVFGESGVGDALTPSSPSATWRPPVRASRSGTAHAVAAAGFVDAHGLDWAFNDKDFRAFDAGGGVYQLRDDGHNPGASEIRILDAGAYTVDDDCETSSYPYATESSTEWDDREEVSAVHTMGEAVWFFKTSFNRNGISNNNTAVYACVHMAGSNARYNRDYYSINFSGATSEEGPPQAAQTVTTHEFMHGITHVEVNLPGGYPWPMTIIQQVGLNEGLSDYFAARHDTSCIGYGMTSTCQRDLEVVPTCPSPSPDTPNTRHEYGYCLSQRFSAALWAGSKFADGSHAGLLDLHVFGAVVYDLTSLDSHGEAAYAILTRAKGSALFDGSTRLGDFLEDKFYSSSLTQWPAADLDVDAPSSSPYEWTVTITNLNNMDAGVVFEIGSNGHYPDGSVVWPDSEIDLGYRWFATPSNAITFEEWETNYHYCGDGHAHGFRLTITGAFGTIPYWTGVDCSPSLRATPTPKGTLPSRFAVRQAVRPRDGASPNLSGSSQATLAGRIRAEGVTALDIDIPAGSLVAPVQITVSNPQGRVVRRFASEALGPGTQRIPWDRKDDAGRDAAPGVYVVVVQHGTQRLRTHFVIPARR